MFLNDSQVLQADTKLIRSFLVHPSHDLSIFAFKLWFQRFSKHYNLFVVQVKVFIMLHRKSSQI